MGKHVFILGATGYIGGAVLVNLKQLFPEWTFAALVRSEKNDAAVKAAGVSEIIRGDHSAHDIIRSESAKADVVLHCADADDLPLAQAVLDGLSERIKQENQLGILIHTSGTGVVSDSSEGAWTPYADKIWNDATEDDIKSIPASQPHRNVDNLIFDYDSKKLVNAYIIAPSTIYGLGDGPVNRISQQIPTIVRSSLQLKKAIIVGEGTNVWNNVHIADLVVLYGIVLKRALADVDKKASPYEKFYFGSVKKHVFGEVQREVGKLLYSHGLVPNAEAERVEFKDIAKSAFLLKYVANNSQSRSDRGFAAGWKPVAPSLFEALTEDVEATLKQL
ncbi:NAD(P)-binding protein [Auriculariales sp. MPI-PUGE-AT-0066]|nr:NAD(P)-binding protein [Auriculariales sp. MPI-PUGE-AT-0066]